jgi:PAS domain S-box-containing protein
MSVPPDRTMPATRGSLDRRLRATLILPLVGMLVLAGCLVGAVLYLLASAGWVDRADQMIAQARRVRTLVAERDDARLDGALAQLGRQTPDSSEQEGLRAHLLDAVTEWRRATDEAAVPALRRVQALSGDFIAGEEKLRDERSWRTQTLSRVFVGATLIAGLLFGLGVGLFGRRQLRSVAAEYESALTLTREQARLLSQEEEFRRLIEAVEDYAIFLLDPDGRVSAWNAGAERGTGWRADEIIGRDYEVFFTTDARSAGRPKHELEAARARGGVRGEELYVRKDGGEFRADVTVTAVRAPSAALLGFAVIAHDVTENRRQQDAIAALNRQLEARIAELAATNAELEAFSYSVSHDLRGPLRAIDGFSQILMEQYRERLDAQGQHFLARVRAGSQRMGQLIDDLLSLAQINRADMRRGPVDLAQIARDVVEELRRHDAARSVDVQLPASAPVRGDDRLLRAALDNLLGNAWKFTGKTARPQIELGVAERDGATAYFVRDNGAGFDMTYAHKLFTPFQRLHARSEFEGTGIGLATVHRIIMRHGGKLWAESTPGQGATFWFTLADDQQA